MSASAGQTRILLVVRPNAARNEIAGFADGVWRVKVSAPPVKGKANKELITFLSQRLGVGKDRLRIIKGHTARNKVIAIEGLNQAEVMRRLSPG